MRSGLCRPSLLRLRRHRPHHLRRRWRWRRAHRPGGYWLHNIGGNRIAAIAARLRGRAVQLAAIRRQPAGGVRARDAVQNLANLLGRQVFRQHPLGLGPLSRHGQNHGVIVLHLHRGVWQGRGRLQQLDRLRPAPAHCQRQRHVDLRRGQRGVDRQRLAVHRLRLRMTPLQVPRDAEIVQRRQIVGIALQNALKQRLGRRRVLRQLDPAKPDRGARRVRVFRQQRLENRRRLVQRPQQRQRVRLDFQRRHIVRRLAQHVVADLQRDLARATAQRRFGDIQAGTDDAGILEGEVAAAAGRQQKGQRGRADGRMSGQGLASTVD